MNLQKHTFVFCCLLCCGILFLNCETNKQEDFNTKNCTTSNLNITENHQFLWENYNPNTYPEPNPKWKWNINGDTLKIKINIPTGGPSGRYMTIFFKPENDCLSFIKLNDVYQGDQVVLDDNDNVIDCDCTIQEYIEQNFELQEWIPNEKIVGKYTMSNSSNDELKFWVAFNSENHFND